MKYLITIVCFYCIFVNLLYANLQSVKKNTILFSLEIPQISLFKKSITQFTEKLFQENSNKHLAKLDMQLEKVLLISLFNKNNLTEFKIDTEKNVHLVSYLNKKNKHIWILSIHCSQNQNCFSSIFTYLKNKQRQGFLVHITQGKNKLFVQYGSKKFQIVFKKNLILFSNTKTPNITLIQNIHKTKEYQLLNNTINSHYKKKKPIAQYYMHLKKFDSTLLNKIPLFKKYFTKFFLRTPITNINNLEYTLGVLEVEEKSIIVSQHFIPKNSKKLLSSFVVPKPMFLEKKIKDPILYIQNHASFQQGTLFFQRLFKEFTFLETIQNIVNKYLINEKPQQTAILIDNSWKQNETNKQFFLTYVLQQQYEQMLNQENKPIFSSNTNVSQFLKKNENTQITKQKLFKWNTKNMEFQQFLTFFNNTKQQTNNLFITGAPSLAQNKFYKSISSKQNHSQIKKVHLLKKASEKSLFLFYLNIPKLLKIIKNTPFFYLAQQYISYISQIEKIQSILYFSDENNIIFRVQAQLN